jgi:hypothetical protein
LSCALSAMALQARAVDQGITTKKLLMASSPKLVLLSKDPSISIAGADPVGGADSSITFDDGTNTATWSLPASNWSTNGSGTLFKYRNTAAPNGPSVVKTAKVKAGLLKLVAKGLPFGVPAGTAAITAILRLDGGARTYCMRFTGTGDGTKFLVKDSAAGTCPVPTTPTFTATSTPPPTATPTLRLPDIPPPGAAPLRYRDLVFSTVNMTSNVTYGHRGQRLRAVGYAPARHLRTQRRHRDPASRDRVGARRLVLLWQ